LFWRARDAALRLVGGVAVAKADRPADAAGAVTP
jgi:hypothetical protein